MDEFKKAACREFTAWDLNCRKHVEHTPRRNKMERKLKRQARRRIKRNILTEDTQSESV